MGANVPEVNALSPFAGQVSVLVSSCDSFFDAWRPFACFFRKFWPHCPFPVYLVSNELEVRSDWMRGIRVGKDESWSTTLRLAAQQIETPHLLYLQEDYFLTRPVDEAQLARDIEFAVEENAASLCFRDLSGLEPHLTKTDKRIILMPADSKGRTRNQVALWQRDAFVRFLQPGESGWEAEARGHERTRDLRMFTYARNAEAPIPYLMSAIVRGLWTREALALCREHGCEIRPEFRRDFPPGKWPRRWNRALTRVGLRLALARQRGKPVDLT